MVEDTSTSAAVGGRQVPFVPYLKLPSSEGEKAHLIGSKCKECGAVFLGKRLACAKCFAVGQFDEVALSTEGKLWVYSIIHQSGPGIPVPYIAIIVDLPEGVAVRGILAGVKPDPQAIEFDMKLELVTEKVKVDEEGNDVMTYKFRPVGS